MNEDRKHADDLDAFLKARKAGQPATPSTPEADLAAELVDLAASLSLGRQPDQPSQRPQTLPSLKSDQLKEHLLKEQFLKEHLLKEQPPMIARSRTDSARSLSLPLVATLLFAFFIGILLLPSFNLPTLAPPVQEESRLPLPVGGHLEGIDQTAMGFMRRAGMEWTVFKITYSPEAKGTVLQTAHQLIDGGHLQGFKVWITITGAPDAFSGSGGSAYDTGASFAGEIAALGADAIQVWETPNLSVRWAQGQLDPANYVHLLRQSYEAIKAANPDTLVITASPAPTHSQEALGSDQVWNDDVYYQGMADAGAANYADCIGVSYTEGAIDPTLTRGDPRDNYPTHYFVSMLQRAAAPFRDSGVPLCLTDYGYLAGQGISLESPFAWAGQTSVEEQADWLAKGIQIAAELSSIRIQMVMLFRIDLSSDTIETHYALIRPDGSCPACDAIALLRQ